MVKPSPPPVNPDPHKKATPKGEAKPVRVPRPPSPLTLPSHCRLCAFFAAQAHALPVPRPEAFLEQLERGATSLPLAQPPCAQPPCLPSFVELVTKHKSRIAITHDAAIAYDKVLRKVRCLACCRPPVTCLRACPCTRRCRVWRSSQRSPSHTPAVCP